MKVNIEYSTIGFIGLGTMGFPMCENLIKRAPECTKFFVYDVLTEPVQHLIRDHPEKVVGCASSKEVADRAEVIFSMVPEGSHVRTVYLASNTGILAGNASGKLLVDCSTIDTATSLEAKDEVHKRFPTASFFDAPVSGGELGAQRGSLTFMLGCSEEDPQLPVLQGLLSMMGTSIVPCGGPSLGLTAKLCNNYCSALIAVATSEAMNIGMRAGMDPRTIQKVFSSSLAQSTVCDKWCPVPGVCPEAPASRGYRGGFKIQLMRKDFGLAIDTAKRLGVTLALGDIGLRTYTDAMNDPKCKDLDSRVVYRYLGGEEDWDGGQSKREA